MPRRAPYKKGFFLCKLLPVLLILLIPILTRGASGDMTLTGNPVARYLTETTHGFVAGIEGGFALLGGTLFGSAAQLTDTFSDGMGEAAMAFVEVAELSGDAGYEFGESIGKGFTSFGRLPDIVLGGFAVEPITLEDPASSSFTPRNQLAAVNVTKGSARGLAAASSGIGAFFGNIWNKITGSPDPDPVSVPFVPAPVTPTFPPALIPPSGATIPSGGFGAPTQSGGTIFGGSSGVEVVYVPSGSGIVSGVSLTQLAFAIAELRSELLPKIDLAMDSPEDDDDGGDFNFVSSGIDQTTLDGYLLLTGGNLSGTLTGTTAGFGTRLGAGTTSPSETLSVNGAVYLAPQGSAPANTTDRLYADSISDLYWNGNLVSGAAVGTWTSSGGNVYRSTGNVGIGTTSPYAKLSVAGLVVGEYFHATSTTATSTFGGNIDVTGNINLNGVLLQDNAPFLGSQWTTSGSNIYYTTGNVGIGTTTPYAKFSVHANNGQTNTTLFSIASSTAVATTTHMVVLNSGNVGIGTAAPVTTLHVVGSVSLDVSGDKYYFIKNASNPDTNWSLGYVTSPSGQILNGAAVIQSVYGDSNGYGYMIRNNSNTSLFEIQGSDGKAYFTGNIGIGTTSPYAKLSVHARSGDTNTTLFAVASSTGSATSTHFAVLSTGNVGIGEAAPTGLLTVYDSTNTRNDHIKLGTSDTSNQFYRIGRDFSSGDLQIVGAQTTFSAFRFYTDNTSQRFTILNDGKVGVGEAAPASRLSVSGNATIGASYDTTAAPSNGLLVEGNLGIATTSPWRTLGVTGTVGFDGLTLNTGAATASLCLSSTNEVTRNTDNESCITSSLRFKHDVEDLESGSALTTINQFRPVSFEYNQLEGTRYGLIAEEVEAIDPLLIGYDPEGRPNSVRYTSIIPLLIQAIQELSTRLAVVEGQLAAAGSAVGDGMVNFITIVTNKISTDELCIGATCINEEQLKGLLEEADATPPSGGGGSGEEPPAEEPPFDEPPGEEPPAEEPPADAPPSEEPESEPEPEEPEEPEDEPAPEPPAEEPPA